MTAAGNSISATTALQECFAEVSAEFAASPAVARLASGQFTVAHYKEYLRQVYYYTRETPQLLTLAAGHLGGSDHEMVELLLTHAAEESGHDQWALNDLAALGEDVGTLPAGNPLPECLAFIAFTYYQILYRDPVAHLGYVYFLEFLPTSSGALYIDLLERLRVPKSAMSFLLEHIKVDAGHNQLMGRYTERLIRTETDLEAVQYSMRVTGKLYAQLLQAAIEQADHPTDW